MKSRHRSILLVTLATSVTFVVSVLSAAVDSLLLPRSLVSVLRVLEWAMSSLLVCMLDRWFYDLNQHLVSYLGRTKDRN
jgi:ABC-type sugar transport system permease subunit